MNKAAFLAGYLDKEAGHVSTRSFGAAVGNATKKALNGSLGGGGKGTSREENLPVSTFIPKYETTKEQLRKNDLKHPVRPDQGEAKERVQEAKP